MASTRPHPGRAFTILELMIVMVIIVILGAIALPRLASTENRAFELAVDQVGDLLTMYGQREALGQKTVGLEHNPNDNSLALLVIDRVTGGLDEAPDWSVDRLVAPVRFPSFIPPEGVRIRADGETVDTSQWPLTHDVGEERPTIEITIASESRVATLVLAPHALSPVRLDADPGVLQVRGRVDLDVAGRDREEW